MRTFVALELSDAFRGDVAALSRQLASCVEGRFVSPSQYHLTLAFLGDADRRAVDVAVDVVESAADRASDVMMRCDGLGKFGRSHDATLWLGLQLTDELAKLARDVRDGLASRDVWFDSKAFKPHITLARRAAIPRESLPLLTFPKSDSAAALTLFKSDLSPQGARYHAMCRRVL